jgi:hypothetical protein
VLPRSPASSRTDKGPTATGRSPGSRVNVWPHLLGFPMVYRGFTRRSQLREQRHISNGFPIIGPFGSTCRGRVGRRMSGPPQAKLASSVVRLRLTPAVLGALRISVANSSSRLRNGGLAGIRTRDLQIKSPLLYRLSYEPTLRGRPRPILVRAFGQVVPASVGRSGASPGHAIWAQFRITAQGQSGACGIRRGEWSGLVMPRCPRSTQ